MSNAPAHVAQSLSFAETMRGPFALGETEPARGAAAGRSAKTWLAFRAAVSIADVAAFASEPSHAANLSGAVSFAPLGEPLDAVAGELRLFAPAPNGVPRAKIMYYGLHVARGARHLFLSGVKHVDGRSMFAMWPETTTLYTRLHDGPDERAPVIGAGVLRLSPLALLRTLPSMRATPRSAIVHFGEFFAGQLWDSYVHKGDARRV